MSHSLVTITKKHKYKMGAPDAGGNKLIYVTGEITMSSFSKTTTTTGMELDLSGDISNLEGIFIQGDGGYFVQYDYTNKRIEVYTRGWVSDTNWSGPLTAQTDNNLAFLVFKFHGWGF